jgi:mannose-6-phosphate isomerase-like protein (cupin superfamily)
MIVTNIDTITDAMGETAWREFLRVPSMSAGVYRLKAGETDGQSPHAQDEVYYVISGRAEFRAGDHSSQVSPGTFLFVEKTVEHRFLNIEEDLTVLVLFAPAENSHLQTQPN